MPQPIVVLASAPQAEPVANHVSVALSRIGFAVDKQSSPASRRAQAKKIENAHRVVLVQARDGRSTPALRAAIQRARAKGKLVCVSPDSIHPAKPLPRTPAAWRSTLANAAPIRAPAPKDAVKRRPRPQAQPKSQTTELKPVMERTKMSSSDAKPHPLAQVFGLLVVTAMFAAMIGGALHQSDPRMAARIDALTAPVKTQVASLFARH